MAIAIHVEVAARELESKLLLGILAADQGHEVFVGDVIGPSEVGLIPKSIFHTKSIVPQPTILQRHARLRRKGMKITVLDDEGPGVEYGLSRAYMARFGPDSLTQVDAFFCWGPEEFEALSSKFPGFSDRLLETGGPRADLWRKQFRGFWAKSEGLSETPFLLVSSNRGIARAHPAHFFEDPEHRTFSRDRLIEELERVSEAYEDLVALTEAIEFVAAEFPGLSIIVRPHPTESVAVWKRLLVGIPNVRVFRDGAISESLSHCVALLHVGCTTALEATLSGVEIISFTPLEQKYLRFSTDLGANVSSLEQLRAELERILETPVGNAPTQKQVQDYELVRSKVRIDDTEMAAEKIVKHWSSLVSPGKVGPLRLAFILLFFMFKEVRDVVSIVFSTKRRRHIRETATKFPKLDRRVVEAKVRDLHRIVGSKTRLRVTLIGPRTVQIRLR